MRLLLVPLGFCPTKTTTTTKRCWASGAPGARLTRLVGCSTARRYSPCPPPSPALPPFLQVALVSRLSTLVIFPSPSLLHPFLHFSKYTKVQTRLQGTLAYIIFPTSVQAIKAPPEQKDRRE